MIRSQRLLLRTTYKQRKLFAGAAGLSRFVWNWAVALCQRHYRMFGKKDGYKRPTQYTLTNRWNKIKKRRKSLAWVGQYSKHIHEASFKAFDKAIVAAFSRLKKGKEPGFPRFHKKGRNDGFQVVPSRCSPVAIKGNRIRIPRIGFVRAETTLRWPNAKQVYGRIKHKAGRWWLTLSYELPEPVPLKPDRPACGIDLGAKTFAVIASGSTVQSVPPLKPYAKAKQRLARAGRWLSRKFKKGKKQSNRYLQAKTRLAKAHERVANPRSNYIHQLTSRLVKDYGTIVLEDLNVQAMGGSWLSGTIQDLGLAEFRRQVAYKAESAGTKVVVADRFFPSSKTCSECGRVDRELKLIERAIWCPCGNMMGRDENAARNLEKLAQGMGEVTRGESGSSLPRRKPKQGAARRTANANKIAERPF